MTRLHGRDGRRGRLVLRDGRTLSGVTRRADARVEPGVLAFAADAVSSAMGVRSRGPRMWGRAAPCRRADQDDDDIAAVPNLTCVGVDVAGRTDLRRMRVRARPAAAGEAEAWVTTCHG